jgi:PKD repeat protein
MRKLLLLAFFFAMPLLLSSQTWKDVGGGLGGDTHGFTVWNNLLAIGGSFNNVPCDKIAAWDTTAFSCFGAGVEIVVRAVIPFEGDLIAVGDFWNINQPCTDCNGVARWDGTQWTNLGTGFNNDVLCLTIWNGDLVAGGDFTTADGNPCSRVARWDGTAWQPIGGPTTFDNDIRALVVYNGDLWAGGDFSNAGGCTACDKIVRWDGTAWVGGNSGVDIPGGLDSTVRALYVDPITNLLYLGGHFLEVGGNTNCSGVAVYDGSAWAPLGTGVNSYVRAIHKYNGNIIVGGDFTNAGGVPANKIAKWKPLISSWEAMGSGMNGYIRALQEYKGELYAGGEFTEADGLSRSYIARWKEVPAVPPVSAFLMSDNNICQGECINFTDNSTGSPTSWNWTFPTGIPSTSTLQNPLVCFSTAGPHLITLTATNSFGSHNSSQSITVSSGTVPLVNVTSFPSATICEGDSATLTATGAASYSWSPSAGLSSTTAASVSAYPIVPTTYTVTGSNGVCSFANTITLNVNPAPVVTTNPVSINICPGGSTNLSASGAVAYLWSPPTGLSSVTTANVIANPGSDITYTVTGTGSNGCTNSDTSLVTVGNSTALPFSEGFESAVFFPVGWTMFDSGSDGNTWQQNNSVGGYVASASSAWFPNNTVNAVGSLDEMRTMNFDLTDLDSVKMFFDIAYCRRSSPSGTDTLSVLASTDCGANWNQVYIKGGNILATAPNQNSFFTPTASEWRTDTIDLSTYDGQPYVMFSFQNHNRNGNNLYLDNINLSGINIAPPVASFTASDLSICASGCISFSETSTQFPTSWNWSFAGGSPSASASQNPPSICWTSPGTYSVSLISCNSNGCDTTTQTITVTNAIANAGSDDTICAGQNISLNGGGGITYLWSPSTGLSCTACPNPVANPADTTIYILTVTDAAGCSDSDSVLVYVDMCTGISNSSVIKKIELSPNPFSHYSVLKVNEIQVEKLKIKLLDVTGKEIKPKTSIKGDALQIERDGLNPGLFFLQVYDGNKYISTIKMIVQ